MSCARKRRRPACRALLRCAVEQGRDGCVVGHQPGWPDAACSLNCSPPGGQGLLR
jgi:hypothetical protein